MNKSLQQRQRRSVIVAAAILFAVIAAFAVRFIGLAVFATEGDVPAASSLHFPDGSVVEHEGIECASGGCWATVSVRPPEGMTPDELSRELGTTPQSHIPGTLWDPRTVNLSSESRGRLLIVRADYWMQELKG